MNIHEFQAKELLAKMGLPAPLGQVCTTAIEAEWAHRNLGKDKISVIKAQVQAGGRGKGGGVKIAKSPEEAFEIASKMLGMTLVTPQTGPEGKKVNKILVVEAAKIEKEYYLSLVLNREKASVSIMASAEGGMEIEEVAAKSPEKITTLHIDPATLQLEKPIWPYAGRILSSKLKLPPETHRDFEKILEGLMTFFLRNDCSMLEINPLAITGDGKIKILDCKISFDENALFRHKDLAALRDFNEEDPRELEASKYGLSYVSLDGNIGCLVNGAGLAMATMDIIKQSGGEPANFLDVGGGANQETVTQAFRIILKDPQVKGIFVNIFGGIMKCDVIANGIVSAAKELGLKVPLVVRLEGTNVDLGKKILSESKLNITAADSMGDGAKKIVAAVR